MVPCVLIEPSGKCSQTFHSRNNLGPVTRLHGADHLKCRFGYSAVKDSRDTSLNLVATELSQYMRELCLVVPKSIVHGPVVVYSVNGCDFTKKHWQLIYDLIKRKKINRPPRELVGRKLYGSFIK